MVQARESRANPPRTEGLTPYDRDRALSLANEGGTSAATVEALDRPAALDDPDEHDSDGQDPKQVDETSQRVRADHAQQPHDDQNSGNVPQHGFPLMARHRAVSWHG